LYGAKPHVNSDDALLPSRMRMLTSLALPISFQNVSRIIGNG